MNNLKTIPVRKWVVRLDSEPVDHGAALDGWMSLIRSQGWSPVGKPEVVSNAQYGEFGIVGKVVEYPGLTLDDAIGVALKVPA